MRSVPSAIKPKSYPGAVASHGPSDLLVTAGRTTPGAASTLFHRRDQVGRLSLWDRPKMRGSGRGREEETRRLSASALPP